MLGNWDDIYSETHEILGFKEKNYADYIMNIKDKSKADSSHSEMRTAKILTLFNKKSDNNKLKFINQVGEYHPDIKLKYRERMNNIEVTKITHADNRFEGGQLKDGHFDFRRTDDVIEHDKVKLMLTSKIVEKAKQYEKWLEKRIIGSTDVNIIAIDCGELFPATPAGPLLFSSFDFLKDTKELFFDINNKSINTLPVSSREFMHKEKLCNSGEKELIPIHHYEILEAIKNGKIDGIFAFFCSLGKIDLQMISINSTLLMDDLYNTFSFSEDNILAEIQRYSFLYE